MSSDQLNSKPNASIIVFFFFIKDYLRALHETVSCCLHVSTDGMDVNGLKFEKKLANFFEF